jgi:hypothetical protein
MGMTRVNVSIGRITLHGFSSAERHAFVDALRRELVRELSSGDASDRAGGMRSRHVGVLRIGPPGTPGPTGDARGIGARIARGIARESRK